MVRSRGTLLETVSRKGGEDKLERCEARRSVLICGDSTVWISAYIVVNAANRTVVGCEDDTVVLGGHNLAGWFRSNQKEANGIYARLCPALAC